MRLVYLSPVPWSSFAQRPHKFVEWFHGATGGDVLWIDPYPARFPALTDFRRLSAKASQENISNPSWLKILRPSALPIEPLPWSGVVNGFIWGGIIKEVGVFSRQQSTLLAIGKPSVLAQVLLKRLDAAVSVYDAMDDFPSFHTGLSRMAMRGRERDLIRRVTHVLVSSTALKLLWGKVRPDVRLVPNGLDASALPAPTARWLARNRAILGYVGTIGPWFDWEWVTKLATMRPSDIVRLIGPVFTPSPSALPSNIEMLPPCAHEDAMLAMREFDVGLIPFKRNELTASVDPIKYYEYKALGLPVISTAFGEMAFREGEVGIYLSRTTQDADELVGQAMGYSADRESVRRFTAANSWSARFDAAKII